MNVWQGKYGPLLVAEIGGNHEGDFEYAKALTELASSSEVDYIKFQIYSGDSIVNPMISPDRHAHFQKFELSPSQHMELAEICKARNKGYMASVWDIEAFDWIDVYISIYKIGSGDLTAYPFIRKIGSTGKPVLLSTGLADMNEVLNAIDYLVAVNPVYLRKDMLGLLQCTSMYPIKAGDANLEVMRSLKDLTGYVVGYSDHTEGLCALEVAYAMGAEVLEFHFTDTRKNKSFRDHKISLTREEVSLLAEKIQQITELKGIPLKKPLEIESEHVTSFRRAVYAKRDIPEGSILSEEDIYVLRPNLGIDARDYYKLVGRKAKIHLKKNQKLDWKFFE